MELQLLQFLRVIPSRGGIIIPQHCLCCTPVEEKNFLLVLRAFRPEFVSSSDPFCGHHCLLSFSLSLSLSHALEPQSRHSTRRETILLGILVCPPFFQLKAFSQAMVNIKKKHFYTTFDKSTRALISVKAQPNLPYFASQVGRGGARIRLRPCLVKAGTAQKYFHFFRVRRELSAQTTNIIALRCYSSAREISVNSRL